MLTGFCILRGLKKVVGHEISAERFLQLVEKFKITYAVTAKTFTYSITNLDEATFKKYNTSSLNDLQIGGSTINPGQTLKLRQLFPFTRVTLAYGSSEVHCVSIFTSTCEEEYHKKISSSGKILPDVEMKFVHLETGKPVGPREEGEIRIKTPYSFFGYYRYEKKDTYDEDGFIKQGDIGYYDEDEFIYVTDRISETFKYKSNHISPSLIEKIITDHPAVRDAVVFGLPHEVDIFHPAACVVLMKNAKVDVNDLIDYVNSKVSDPQKLRGGLKIVNGIPTTPSGKIQRRSIRDNYINLP